MPVRYQGEDIDLTLTIDQMQASAIEDLDDIERLVAYFYTNQANIAKYEWRADGESTGEDYTPLTPSADRKSLTAVIDREKTLLWKGPLFCDILAEDATDQNYRIKHVNTGVEMRGCPIRQEATPEE